MRAPTHVRGINWRDTVADGLYDSWIVGWPTRRIAKPQILPFTSTTSTLPWATKLGRGVMRDGSNAGQGYVDLESHDGGTMDSPNGYTIVALIYYRSHTNSQGLADDDSAITRTLQFRIETDDTLQALVWNTSGTLEGIARSTETLIEGPNIVAMRVIDGGEVSVWINGVKCSGAVSMAVSARPIFVGGVLRLFIRKRSTWNPSNSIMYGVHIYKEPAPDFALKSLGTPAGFWRVWQHGSRLIVTPGAATAGGDLLFASLSLATAATVTQAQGFSATRALALATVAAVAQSETAEAIASLTITADAALSPAETLSAPRAAALTSDTAKEQAATTGALRAAALAAVSALAQSESTDTTGVTTLAAVASIVAAGGQTHTASSDLASNAAIAAANSITLDVSEAMASAAAFTASVSAIYTEAATLAAVVDVVQSVTLEALATSELATDTQILPIAPRGFAGAITLSASATVSASGFIVDLTIATPDGRTLYIASDDRSLTVAADDRTVTISA